MVLRGDPTASFQWVERTAERATVRLLRDGRDTVEVTYEWADAERAGLTSKDNWKKYPKDMLAAKALTRACRLGGPDLITAVGNTARGAPAVLRAFTDTIDNDEAEDEGAYEEPAQLDEPADDEPYVEENNASTTASTEPAFVRLARWLRDARQTWDERSYKTMLAQVNAENPGALSPNGDLMIGRNAMSEERAAQVLAQLEGTAQQGTLDG
jgi:hypothetical protein